MLSKINIHGFYSLDFQKWDYSFKQTNTSGEDRKGIKSHSWETFTKVLMGCGMVFSKGAL